MDQPGKVANPARGQLNRENNISLSPCVPENLVSRDGFSRPVPRHCTIELILSRLHYTRLFPDPRFLLFVLQNIAGYKNAVECLLK